MSTLTVGQVLIAKHTKRRIYYGVYRVGRLDSDTIVGLLYRLRHDGVSMDTNRAALIYKGRLLGFRLPEPTEDALPPAIRKRVLTISENGEKA